MSPPPQQQTPCPSAGPWRSAVLRGKLCLMKPLPSPGMFQKTGVSVFHRQLGPEVASKAPWLSLPVFHSAGDVKLQFYLIFPDFQ